MMLKLIIPALLEQGLLMSAVFLLEALCGQGKIKGVIPSTSQAHCSNTASYICRKIDHFFFFL